MTTKNVRAETEAWPAFEPGSIFLSSRQIFAANQAPADPALNLIEGGGQSAFGQCDNDSNCFQSFICSAASLPKNRRRKSGGQPSSDSGAI
jgi:hypothetical protein